jgi:hypothetical protein
MSVQSAIAFALILGWAVGSAVEHAWRSEEPHRDDFLFGIAGAALARLLGGTLVFLTIMGIDFGFEALGIGLGAH